MKRVVDLFIELGKKQANLFSESHIPYIECVVTCAGMRNVMLTVYNSAVFRGEIKPLEILPQEDKLSIWETAKEMSKDRLDKNGVIELSKVLHTLEYYLNN